MTEYSKIYPQLDPTAPLDEALFNKSRALNFMATLDTIERTITEKCAKAKKRSQRYSSTSQIFGVISTTVGVGAGATSATLIGIPVGASLGGVASFAAGASLVAMAIYKKTNKKKNAYLQMLDKIHTARASYEYAFSASLSNDISLEEFARLQKIFNDLLRAIDSKLFRTDALIKDVNQQDFLQNITAMVVKKA